MSEERNIQKSLGQKTQSFSQSTEPNESSKTESVKLPENETAPLRVCSVSGGKDSTALYLWMTQNFGPNFTAVFADTSHEHPVTVNYVRNLAEIAGGPPIHIVKRSFKKELGVHATGVAFLDLLRWKGRGPSARAQFCTTELKMAPIRDFIESIRGDREVEVYVGIRREESISRSTLPEKEYSPFYDGWIYRPLIEWTTDDVWELLREHHVDRNPLYTLGWSRVGCFPCIHSRKAELASLPQWAWSKLIFWEAKFKRTFFGPNKVSGHLVCDASKVRAWSQTEYGGKVPLESPIAEKDSPSCMSSWGHCE